MTSSKKSFKEIMEDEGDTVISNSTLQDDEGFIFSNNSKYEVTIPKGTTVYFCPLCQKWFKSLEDFTNHNTGVCQ